MFKATFFGHEQLHFSWLMNGNFHDYVRSMLDLCCLVRLFFGVFDGILNGFINGVAKGGHECAVDAGPWLPNPLEQNCTPTKKAHGEIDRQYKTIVRLVCIYIYIYM